MPKISVGYNVIFEYKRMRLFLSVYSMSFRLLQKELTPCYAKLSGATVNSALQSVATFACKIKIADRQWELGQNARENVRHKATVRPKR